MNTDDQGDVTFQSGSKYSRDTLRLEWDRTEEGKIFLFGPAVGANGFVLAAEDVDDFIEALESLRKGAPRCKHCKGTGKA